MNHRINAELLKALRVEHMIERKELAQASGVSYSTLAQLETNPNRTARTQTIKNLARALDIDPVKLVRSGMVSFEIGGEMGDAEDLHPLVVLELSDGTRVVGV
jgi:transcriptional regulator with XRE-family HTH domain